MFPNATCYHKLPIELQYGNLDLGGAPSHNPMLAQKINLEQSYIGPGIIVAPNNQISQTPITGPFAGSSSYQVNGSTWLNFNDIMNSPAYNLRGLGGSGFHSGIWINVGTFTTGPVFGGSDFDAMATNDGQTTIPSLVWSITSADKIEASMNWGGSNVSVTSTGTFSANTWYYGLFNCVSGTCTLYVGGASEGTASYSGTIEENTYETWTTTNGGYPFGGYNSTPPAAYIYGIDVEDAAAGSPTNVPAAPQTNGTNTLLLTNFTVIPNTNHNYQLGYYGSAGTPNVVIPYWNINEGGNAPSHVRLHDINLTAAAGGATDGIELDWVYQAELDHVLGYL